MPSSIFNVTLDCADPWQLAEFWAYALGSSIDPDNEPHDDEVGVLLPQAGELILQRVPEPKVVKNRQHLCLRPDQDRDQEVQQLVDRGASVVEDQRRPDGTGWVVMSDPEGNEFCVLRSAAEVERTSA